MIYKPDPNNQLCKGLLKIGENDIIKQELKPPEYKHIAYIKLHDESLKINGNDSLQKNLKPLIFDVPMSKNTSKPEFQKVIIFTFEIDISKNKNNEKKYPDEFKVCTEKFYILKKKNMYQNEEKVTREMESVIIFEWYIDTDNINTDRTNSDNNEKINNEKYDYKYKIKRIKNKDIEEARKNNKLIITIYYKLKMKEINDNSSFFCCIELNFSKYKLLSSIFELNPIEINDNHFLNKGYFMNKNTEKEPINSNQGSDNKYENNSSNDSNQKNSDFDTESEIICVNEKEEISTSVDESNYDCINYLNNFESLRKVMEIKNNEYNKKNIKIEEIEINEDSIKSFFIKENIHEIIFKNSIDLYLKLLIKNKVNRNEKLYISMYLIENYSKKENILRILRRSNKNLDNGKLINVKEAKVNEEVNMPFTLSIGNHNTCYFIVINTDSDILFISEILSIISLKTKKKKDEKIKNSENKQKKRKTK